MKGLMVYIPGDTLIHRLDPRTKILFPLMLCIGCFAAKSIFFLLAVFAVDFLIAILGGIVPNALRILKGLLKIALFLFILQVLVIRYGTPVFYLFPKFPVTQDGLRTGLSGALRLIDITLPLALMISLTKMSDLSNALVSRWHIPYKYAFAVTSAIRFIPIFSTDLQTIIEAQTARGVEFDTKNVFRKLQLLAPLCVPLLVSSVKKTESAAIAVELRGFNLRGKDSCYKKAHFVLMDLIVLGIGAGLAVIGFLC